MNLVEVDRALRKLSPGWPTSSRRGSATPKPNGCRRSILSPRSSPTNCSGAKTASWPAATNSPASGRRPLQNDK